MIAVRFRFPIGVVVERSTADAGGPGDVSRNVRTVVVGHRLVTTLRVEHR